VWQSGAHCRRPRGRSTPPLLTAPEPGVSVVNIGPYRRLHLGSRECVRASTLCVSVGQSPLAPPVRTLDVNDTTWGGLWAQASDIVLAGSYFQVMRTLSVTPPQH